MRQARLIIGKFHRLGRWEFLSSAFLISCSLDEQVINLCMNFAYFSFHWWDKQTNHRWDRWVSGYLPIWLVFKGLEVLGECKCFIFAQPTKCNYGISEASLAPLLKTQFSATHLPFSLNLLYFMWFSICGYVGRLHLSWHMVIYHFILRWATLME